MPCDTIQTNTVEVGKMHPGLLKTALTALGATGIIASQAGTSFTLRGQRIQISNGRMLLREGSESIADQVKVAYSRQAVYHAAKSNGWQVRETKPNVFAVVK